MADENLFYAPSVAGEALRQGEILSNLSQYTPINPEADGGASQYHVVKHALVIVLSQECDLDLEFRARNGIAFENGKIPEIAHQISNILFCDVFPDVDIRGRADINPRVWDHIKGNNHERFGYLHSISANDDALGQEYPFLVVDFRRYFTLTATEVYSVLGTNTQRRCRLQTPYAEHLTVRFTRFLSRIALPRNH